jgi:CheY-like chemotaxis protein
VDRRRPISGLRILVVDDCADIRVLVGTILAHYGASYDTAADGEEANRLALSTPYDVVLMDLHMPGMDGYETVRMLRRAGYARSVVALTAQAFPEDRVRCLESGFDDQLAKPIDHQALLSVLGRAVYQPGKH